MIPSLILKRYFSWRQTIGAGFLISSRLSLIIAIALVAWESGIISETTYSTFILVAIITCIFSPILFSKIFPPYQKKKEAIIIAGNSDILVLLIGKLDLSGQTVILTGTGERISKLFYDSGIQCIYWDNVDIDKIQTIKNTVVNTLVATYEDDYKNQALCIMAKKSGIKTIVALISDPKISLSLEKQGINTVTPMKAMYTLLHGFIKYPEYFEVLYNPEASDNIDVCEIKPISQAIVNSKLRELNLPGDCLVLMISREGKRIVPDGNTRLEKNDILVIIGSKEYMIEIRNMYLT